MPLAPSGFTLGALRPEDAISVFEQRKLLRPSFRWQEVWQHEHARAFAVAGVMRLDILADFRTAVQKVVEEGGDLQAFSRELKGTLQRKGWWGNLEITDPKTGEVRKSRFDDARLRLIFDVNMRQSHAAGRWQRLQRSRMPYVVYRTMRDERVRASHKPWDNVVLPKDHPWWDTHTPPCGWRCRCTFFGVDEAGLRQLRDAAPKESPVKTEAPDTKWVEFLNKVTGQVERVPRGIDPGFAYNPGKVHVQRGVELLDRTLASVKPTLPGGGGKPGTADAFDVTRRVIGRMRSESGFRDFLSKPPPPTAGGPVGMPVATVPAVGGEPPVVSVSGSALLDQATSADFPRPLPTTPAGWALAQAIVDRGQRLDLGGGTVLWWWVRGAGDTRRVLVLELQRSQLVWWAQRLVTLTPEEAAAAYPRLGSLL